MNNIRTYFLDADQFDACIRAADYGKDFDALSPIDRVMCSACSIKLHKILEIQREWPYDSDRGAFVIFEHADEMEDALGHAWVCLAMDHSDDPIWAQAEFPQFDNRIAHPQASGGEIFTAPRRRVNHE